MKEKAHLVFEIFFIFGKYIGERNTQRHIPILDTHNAACSLCRRSVYCQLINFTWTSSAVNYKLEFVVPDRSRDCSNEELAVITMLWSVMCNTKKRATIVNMPAILTLNFIQHLSMLSTTTDIWITFQLWFVTFNQLSMVSGSRGDKLVIYLWLISYDFWQVLNFCYFFIFWIC